MEPSPKYDVGQRLLLTNKSYFDEPVEVVGLRLDARSAWVGRGDEDGRIARQEVVPSYLYSVRRSDGSLLKQEIEESKLRAID